MPNKLRLSAASQRPFDDSSRMKACCACTSINCFISFGTRCPSVLELTVNEQPAPSITSRMSVRPALSTCVSCSISQALDLVARGTHLLAKDHDDLSFTLEISILDLFDGVVCFAFAESCRVDTVLVSHRAWGRISTELYHLRLTRSRNSRKLTRLEHRKHTIPCQHSQKRLRDQYLPSAPGALRDTCQSTRFGHCNSGGRPVGLPTRSHLHHMPLRSFRSSHQICA